MQSFSIPALPDIRSPTRRRGTAQAPEIPAADSIFGKNRYICTVWQQKRDSQSTEAHVADVGSNLREKPAGNPGGGRASLETGPCDHLLLYIYIVPHTLPAGNDIGDTTPFEVEIRIAYGGRRLRAEKRLINQWSGASIEMRVDSEAR